MTAPEASHQTDARTWLSAVRASTGYVLMKVGEVASARAAQVLEPLHLRPRQVLVLATLAADETLSQQDVSRRLGIDPNVLVGVIDDLEDRVLVQRRRNPQDRRRHLVTLTDAGRRLLQEAIASLDAADRALRATMTADELAVVHAVAHRLLDEPGDGAQDRPKPPGSHGGPSDR